MKWSNTFAWSVGLLLAQVTLWMIIASLYLYQHPEAIQYNVGVA